MAGYFVSTSILSKARGDQFSERSIAEACWIMTDKNIGRLVAEDQGKVCRILPDRDRAEGDREDKEPLATMVEEVMTRDPGADLRVEIFGIWCR